MSVPLTPLELKVRVQIKGKVKAKPSNPQHPLSPCTLGRPFRAVRSALYPQNIYRSSSQSHPTLLPPSFPFFSALGRPFRAVRSALVFPTFPHHLHPNPTLWAVHLRPSVQPVPPHFTPTPSPFTPSGSGPSMLGRWGHQKKKTCYPHPALSLLFPSLRPTRRETSFVWQQGTWANAPAGDVPYP